MGSRVHKNKKKKNTQALNPKPNSWLQVSKAKIRITRIRKNTITQMEKHLDLIAVVWKDFAVLKRA